jgi:hypothetical protein
LRESRRFSTAFAAFTLRFPFGAATFNRSNLKGRIPFRVRPFKNAKEKTMGLLEELAGAAAAVEGAKKLDPNAGIVTEGVAAVVGFEGAKEITEFIEKKEEEHKDQ